MYQAGQHLLQLKEQTLAGCVAVGVHVEKPTPAPSLRRGVVESESERSSSMSFFVSRVAEGMAMALWPAESMAQQSLQPSVM